MVDLSKVNFLSSLNYLKRESSLVGNSTLTLGGAGTTVTYDVTHNLGYVPFYTIGAEVSQDGILWSNEVVDQYTQTTLTGISNDYPTLMSWCTTTTLTIALYNNTSPVQSGAIPIYWSIYLDYTT